MWRQATVHGSQVGLVQQIQIKQIMPKDYLRQFQYLYQDLEYFPEIFSLSAALKQRKAIIVFGDFTVNSAVLGNCMFPLSRRRA